MGIHGCTCAVVHDGIWISSLESMALGYLLILSRIISKIAVGTLLVRYVMEEPWGDLYIWPRWRGIGLLNFPLTLGMDIYSSN